MADLLDVEEFVARSRTRPVLDVRTPAEFADGHVPGAHNVPLFSNEERALIGTTYAEAGRQAAMMEALDLVGPKMRRLVESAMDAVNGSDVLMYCWRGGMRSESMAWLLSFFGYRVGRLRGGYKAFRRFACNAFTQELPIRILGGLSGSGKTDVLHALQAHGAQIIDLEGLARHRGSVFGGLGRGDQPTQQQFENELALQWHVLDPQRPVWIEDESRRIGDVGLPNALFDQMQAAPTFVLDIPYAARLDRLVDLYGAFEARELHDALDYIRQRLGGLRTQQAHAAISTGHLRRACRIILNYYDDAYQHGLDQRPADTVQVLPVDTPDASAIANEVLDRASLPTT
jgi:tRNA 2-selenouridine synthase